MAAAPAPAVHFQPVSRTQHRSYRRPTAARPRLRTI